MKNTKLTFIGAGNMARSLIGGLIADGWQADRITVADPNEEQLSSLHSHFPVNTVHNNQQAADGSEVIVFAVKPQAMHDVATDLASMIKQQRPLVVSIAAGIRSTDLQRWSGGETALVRCMPNTPALVQSGATALFANDQVSSDQRSLAESILRAVGLTVWVDDEDQMDAVTALSGSGPAYFFLVMEAMQEAGQTLGLPPDTARLLALQTAFGASKMALESSEDAATLRQRVTSPGGTTEKALEALQNGGLQPLFAKALKAAYDRSRELAKQFGAD